MLSFGNSFQGGDPGIKNNGSIFLFCLLSCFLICSSAASQNNLKPENDPAPTLHIAYIGNMGVLLSSGGDAILIDGLHREYKPAYIFPSDSTTAQIIQGDYQDYGRIDMALITHYHRDHFDAGLSSAFLKANPNSYVLGAPQVIDKIRTKQEVKLGQLERQLKSIPYDDTVHSIKQNTLKVEVFKCPHVNKARHASVQNLAYIIHVRGYSILHLGDSNWDVASNALQNANLFEQKIDVAILPYWMLLDRASKEKVERLISPKKLIATHVPPNLGQRERALLHQHHTDLTIFERLHQQLIHP